MEGAPLQCLEFQCEVVEESDTQRARRALDSKGLHCCVHLLEHFQRAALDEFDESRRPGQHWAPRPGRYGR